MTDPSIAGGKIKYATVTMRRREIEGIRTVSYDPDHRVFLMGMGYTFYLPFALYVLGLICWSYTVIKLVTIGRLAGYGLGLMFMAGYALQLSHLTLLVVLGLMLLTIDKRGTLGKLRRKMKEKVVYQPIEPAFGQTR